MATINSGSLFHYTRNFDTLKSILSNGLRYSFSYEEFDKEFILAYRDCGHNMLCNTLGDASMERGIAMPMVSFCDIPLLRTSNHRKRYGNYCIGLDKTNFLSTWEGRISPVNYLSAQAFRDRFVSLSKLLNKIGNFDIDEWENYIQEITKGKNAIAGAAAIIKDKTASQINSKLNDFFQLKCYVSEVTALSKPIVSASNNPNYDEREWRAYTLDEIHKWGKWEILTKVEFNSKRDCLNCKLSNTPQAHITLNNQSLVDAISYIIIDSEKERQNMLDYIKNAEMLFGHKIQDNGKISHLKDLIISKITSFDRIEKDY